jgi:hypothetical protein
MYAGVASGAECYQVVESRTVKPVMHDWLIVLETNSTGGGVSLEGDLAESGKITLAESPGVITGLA